MINRGDLRDELESATKEKKKLRKKLKKFEDDFVDRTGRYVSCFADRVVHGSVFRVRVSVVILLFLGCLCLQFNLTVPRSTDRPQVS